MVAFGIVFGIVLGGIVLVILAALVLRYRREMRTARERLNSFNSQVIETDCGPIEYVRMGDGYPVLVVHGALGGFDQGLRLARGFNVSKYQVIAVSRFGHLRSPVPPDATLDTQADAFACLLDALKIQQAAVLAISGGSTSAIRFAARHPERISSLVLLCPDAPPGISLPPRFVFDTLLRSDFLYWTVVSSFPKTVQEQAGFVPKGYVLTSEYEAVIKQVLKGNLPISKRIDGFIFESYTTAAEFQASISTTSPYPLGKIETPVLVIDALDDPITIPENVRRLAEQMPNARLLMVPDGGHFFFGHTEEVKIEIAEFLRSSAQCSLENSL
jgi:2-hydroxy-6-oxonona-2,4-dienedioate hydrolase